MGKVAFLGIGQCGGNICDVAERHGFLTGAINLCKEDLQCLKYVKSKLYLNGYGAGKDRSVAIEKVKEDFDNIAGWICNNYNDNDVEIIYVVFSSGGGTGSGIGPMIIDLMSDIMPHKRWGSIVVLPFENEGLSVYLNTLKCMEELTEIRNLASVFFIDNAKTSNFTRLSRKNVIEFTNNNIIENIKYVIEVTKNTSKFGNFDMKDLISILSERGNVIISKVNLPENYDPNKVSIQQMIESGLEINIFTDIQFDKVITKAGIIYEVEEQIFNLIDNKTILKNIGNPVDLFEGYYLSGKNSITVILSGMTFPFNTLKEIDDSLQNDRDKIKNTIEIVKTQQFKSKSFEFINIVHDNKKSIDSQQNITKPSLSLKEKLAKYK
ncbi:hypothetical protein [Thermosipho sp. (in: thermotogales)]|jgi:cell division GTPase FtsZ|uniref:hypothetical protein n=1 Tax=Thermosipho sp. (in: thermotogales) TaxID=1968895 RepID=UPI00257A0DEB|nr:hypothetical protein [Thermosipho sp. (in: thermotogales)]MBZ4649150.1 cell division protein FtsZ [Thermosipho sp. (in: thermotogales)]